MEDYEGAQKHVYMVDTHANYPRVPRRGLPSKPLPPLPPLRSHGGRQCQTLMVLLMFFMFCFTAVQAVFLYRLYYPTAKADSPYASKITHDRRCDSPDISMTSKPLAHLTDGFNVKHGKDIMSWSTDGDSLLRQMRYKDRQLIVKIEGFYFIYSKVFFLESAPFDHSVHLKSRTYQRGSIALLKTRTIPQRSVPPAKSNSYIGGVFQLRKGDILFVHVSNTAQVIHALAAENFFGAFMIYSLNTSQSHGGVC